VSDYLAVAAVSAVLRSLLTTALTVDGPQLVLGASDPGITALSPSLVKTGREERPQLNLFMYYFSIDPALDVASTSEQGEELGISSLALDLHYLVSAYGSEQLAPEVLLGFAMKVFHDTPVVSGMTIQKALGALATSNATAAEKLIGNSALANQIEHIRITPEALTTEEIYRLWPAFHAAYRPSIAIQISVVVIQDT
jgi:Pvc16 N-terminal domain